MVEDIERVKRDGECRDVLLVFAVLRCKRKIVRKVEVEIDEARTV